MLVLTAMIWGLAFVAQSVGMDYIGPFTFSCVRSLMGGMVLIPCILFLDRNRTYPAKKQSRESIKTLAAGGISCGIALCIATNLQQVGIQYTTAGKAGFITALYIVVVPLLGIFLRKKIGLKIWCSVAVAVAGLYLLCMTEKLTVGKGDFLVLLCALVFSIHILLVDHFAPKVDGIRMSCIQFLVTGILSAGPMVILERPTFRQVSDAAIPLLYAGVLSCGVAYTLQVVAQKNVDPTVASLILSLESVFSVLAGRIILGEQLSAREFGGCVLMFVAIIMAQLPEKTAVPFSEEL